MRYRNGWSARKTIGGARAETVLALIPVAAAASVPV